MRSTFPLFQSHLDLVKIYWKQLLKPADWAIDATCGNGKDVLFLASLIPNGKLIGIDIQEKAIQATQDLLTRSLTNTSHVQLIQQSHATFPEWIPNESIALVVYNLGYLPGGNKEIVTSTEGTLKSVQSAKELLKKGGILTITCYPGHLEGKKEESLLIEWSRSLSPKEWSVCHHQWLNRQHSPSLIVIQKCSPEIIPFSVAREPNHILVT